MVCYTWRRLKKRVLLFLLICLSVSYFFHTNVFFQNRLPVLPIVYSKTKETSKQTQLHDPISLNPRVKVLPWNFVTGQTFVGQEHIFRPKETTLQFLDFDFKLKGENMCKETPPFLLTMVPSLPKDQDIRASIRETWASVSKSQEWPLRIVNAEVKVIFLLGNATAEEFKDIQEENAQHQDIIMAEFVDSYRNLSRKILMGLTWVREYCSGVQFILKCDQDTFPNIPLIVDFLIAFQPQFNMSVIGYIFGKSRVLRTGKWQVNRFDYPINNYPPYASGNAYIMPRDLAFHVLNVSKHMPYISVEDAYITGILTRVVHGKHVHSKTFTSLSDKNPKTCEFLKDQRQASTRTTKYFMQAIWKTFQNNKCYQ